MRVLSLIRIVIACCFVLLISQGASGSGFDSNLFSTSSFSQGNAVVAYPVDTSVIFFNPALMNKLEQSQIMIGTAILFGSNEFRSDVTNEKYEMEDNTHFMPSLFAIYKINDSITAGLGVFSNFGLSSTWPDDWEGRYIATESELTTFNINPSISVRVSQNIYLGGGISILTFDTELNKNINLSSFMLPDVKQKMKGDDVGVGYNLGLLVDITEDLSFGASYRSQIKVDVDGDVSHKIPSVIPPTVASMFPNTSVSTDVTLPAQAFIGIAYKGLKPFVFEVAGRWIGWSSYDELKINLDKPIAGISESVIPKNWDDSYTLHLGTQYHVSDIVTLNAGYMYDESPIPDETFEPSIPDSDTHYFCLGADIQYKDFTVGLMYSYAKSEDRDKNNTIDDNPNDEIVDPLTSANGEYKRTGHFAAIHVTYRF